METLLTVLITLIVVSLTGAGIMLVRLNRKAQEHDMLQMEVIDVQNRIDGWVASTDRRFDKAYNEIQRLNETVNPNSDLLKK